MVVRLACSAALVGCSFTPGRLVPRDDAGDTDGDAPDADPAGGGDGPDAASAGIAFVQGAAVTNAGSHQLVFAPFPTAQTAGDLNVVVVSWSDQSGGSAITGVTDAHGTTYFSALQLMQAQGFSQRIYWAANIPGGANVVTAGFSNSVASPKLRIFEYAGIAHALPVDMSMAANGSSNTASAGPVNTTVARELIFAAEVGAVAATGAGTDFTERQLDNGDLVEDRIVDTTGAYSATAPLSDVNGWIMQLVSFKGI